MTEKSYDQRHRDKGEELSIGDLVVKEQQKNKSRKGGKLEKVREDNLFVIEEILPNGNIMLWDMDKNPNETCEENTNWQITFKQNNTYNDN